MYVTTTYVCIYTIRNNYRDMYMYKNMSLKCNACICMCICTCVCTYVYYSACIVTY